MQSDGTPWRPLVHIEDISRAALAVLEAPRELDPRRGVQRLRDGGELHDPRGRRDRLRGHRRAGDVRRRQRRAGHALVPRRRVQARPRAAGRDAAVDGQARRRGALPRLPRVGHDLRGLHGPAGPAHQARARAPGRRPARRRAALDARRRRQIESTPDARSREELAARRRCCSRCARRSPQTAGARGTRMMHRSSRLYQKLLNVARELPVVPSASCSLPTGAVDAPDPTLPLLRMALKTTRTRRRVETASHYDEHLTRIAALPRHAGEHRSGSSWSAAASRARAAPGTSRSGAISRGRELPRLRLVRGPPRAHGRPTSPTR